MPPTGPPGSGGPPPGQPRITRPLDGRVVGGVAAGIARRKGFDPLLLRIGLVVLAVAGGSGALLYVIAWLVLPADDADESIAQRALKDRTGTAQILAVTITVVAVLMVLQAAGLWFSGAFTWPLALTGAGVAIIWRQADEADRAPLDRMAAHFPGGRLPGIDLGSRRAFQVRLAVGFVLVLAGATAFLALNHAIDVARQGLVAFLGIVGGIGLIFGPWWWRLGRELADERRERIRSQERAEMAAHIHDSVLQTLALIQRRAQDPKAVVNLARRQERELRMWLFGAPGASPGGPRAENFADALAQLAAEVEEVHDAQVEVVTVGDCPMDDRADALLAAAREAVVNAAKWSKAETVALYAEVEPERLSVFVRDRGCGFDPAAVGADRRGIAESIVGRMSRHGGHAKVTSELGRGTEVELVIPREVAA